jgi:hypothetical protein
MTQRFLETIQGRPSQTSPIMDDRRACDYPFVSMLQRISIERAKVSCVESRIGSHRLAIEWVMLEDQARRERSRRRDGAHSGEAGDGGGNGGQTLSRDAVAIRE